MSLPNQPPPIPPEHRKKSWLRRNLVMLVTIIVALGLPVWFISTAVSAMMRRAVIVKCMTELRSAESAMIEYLSLPESKGELIITEGTETPVPIWDGNVVQMAGSCENYTFDQILLECGALEVRFRLPFGKNAPTDIDEKQEPKYSLKHRAFYASGLNVDGVETQAGQNWTAYNRIETSLVDDRINEISPKQFPIVFNNGKIDRVNFFLNGKQPLNGRYCAYYIFKQLSMRDAKRLSQEYNGILDDTEHQNHQYRGRLIFEEPGASGKTDVYYYLISVNDNGIAREYWKSDDND